MKLLNSFMCSLLACALSLSPVCVLAHQSDKESSQHHHNEQTTFSAEIAKIILNEALNTQRVFVTAPGLPSKLHDMALIAEDPDAKENAHKKYHPAEREGWKRMLAYGEALEHKGVLKITHGTFFDDDFYDRRFKFTGVLMEFKPEMKEYIAVTPLDGRVLMRVGYSGVKNIDKMEKLSGKDERYKVEFTTALSKISPWYDDDVAKFAQVSSLLGGKESTVIKVENGKAFIDDEAFFISLKKPVTDFSK